MLLCLIGFIISNAQDITFQKTYGGIDGDVAFDMKQTNDNGYIVCGFTSSYGSAIYLIKLTAAGDTTWTKTYGKTPDGVWGISVKQTTDKGYLVTGYTSYALGSCGPCDEAVYVIKTDSLGNIIWSKNYGPVFARFNSTVETADNGYILAGNTVGLGQGQSDIYLVKTDSAGSIVWTKVFGGIYSDEANSIQPTSDGGYIIAGTTGSFGAGISDICLLKIDTNGNIQWTKTYGGIDYDLGADADQTTDGGYIVVGSSISFSTTDETILIKTDSNGNVIWSRSFNAGATSVQQTSDGGFAFSGNFKSGTTSDISLVKTDATGNPVWNKSYGGLNDDEVRSSHQTQDGGFIMAGMTNSFGAGGYDVYLIKTDSIGNSGCADGWPALTSSAVLLQTNIPAFVETSGGTVNDNPPNILSGCQVTTLCIVTANDEIFTRTDAIIVYPNPCSSIFTVSLSEAERCPTEGKTYWIVNEAGQAIRSFELNDANNYTMNIEGLTSGIYFVSGVGNDNDPDFEVTNQKIIVTK